MMHLLGLVAIITAVGISTAALAETICVPDDYPTIQAAIDAAADGDEICVAPGTYNEAIDFLGKAVRLYSTGGADVTTIMSPAPGQSVVRCLNATDASLDGFTITGGDFVGDGGGMHVVASSIAVSGCRFLFNRARVDYSSDNARGGGLYVVISTLELEDCSFEGNWTEGEVGGGLYAGTSTVRIDRCTFLANTATGCRAWGGGIALHNCHASIVGSRIAENTALDDAYCGGGSSGDAYGGGVWVHGYGFDVDFVDCEIVGNTVQSLDYPGGSGRGSGVYVWGEPVTFVNCLIARNRDDTEHGAYACAVDSYYEPYTVIGSTVANNPNGGVCGSTVNVRNSIIQSSHLAEVAYSCVDESHPGPGVITADPLFVNPDIDDYRLSPGSPCIDAGHNWGVPRDTLDLDEDGNTDELIPFDLDGNPRFNADEIDFDPGCGVPVVVDMGAYEYQYDPVEEILVGDVDGDGEVAFTDLVAVLGAWDPCDAECCLADVDFSWQVDFSDLLIVLANWT